MIGSRDQERLKGLFEFKSLDNLASAYYVSRGVALLGSDNNKVSGCGMLHNITVVVVTGILKCLLVPQEGEY